MWIEKSILIFKKCPGVKTYLPASSWYLWNLTMLCFSNHHISLFKTARIVCPTRAVAQRRGWGCKSRVRHSGLVLSSPSAGCKNHRLEGGRSWICFFRVIRSYLIKTLPIGEMSKKPLTLCNLIKWQFMLLKWKLCQTLSPSVYLLTIQPVITGISPICTHNDRVNVF